MINSSCGKSSVVESVMICVLILLSVPLIALNSSFGDDATTIFSDAQTSDSNQVSISSGRARFAVWVDETPGNSDILFKRSIDAGATWKPVVNLSTNPGTSVWPQMAVNGANIYLVWCQDNAEENQLSIIFRGSKDNGVSWGPKIKLVDQGPSCQRIHPQVAASGNHVYVIWHNSQDVLFTHSSNNGESFGSAVNLSKSGTINTINLPKLAAAGSNVYVGWDDSSGSGDILFIRSTNNGGSWGSATNLSKTGDADWEGPELLAVGSNVYAVWSGPGVSGFDVYFTRSTNNGGSWSGPVNLSKMDGSSSHAKIAVAGTRIYVVWSYDGLGQFDILMRRSTDGGATWKAIKNLSNNDGSSEHPGVAASGANVFFTWQDDTGGDTDIVLRKSSDGGATLDKSINISHNDGSSFEPQVIAVGTDVYVSWEDDTPDNFDVFLRGSADVGTTWKSAINLSKNAAFSGFSQVAG